MVMDEGLGLTGFYAYLDQWLWPAVILAPAYYNTFKYSVMSKRRETMPETFTRRGLITTTERHVQFRTITNISSKAGPLDKLLGIGSIEVETAGFTLRASGQPGPEEKIEGIVFYDELRDFILRELRKFRRPYVTGTEIVTSEERAVPELEDSLQDDDKEYRESSQSKKQRPSGINSSTLEEFIFLQYERVDSNVEDNCSFPCQVQKRRNTDDSVNVFH